jgi:hypothetical protein
LEPECRGPGTKWQNLGAGDPEGWNFSSHNTGEELLLPGITGVLLEQLQCDPLSSHSIPLPAPFSVNEKLFGSQSFQKGEE